MRVYPASNNPTFFMNPPSASFSWLPRSTFGLVLAAVYLALAIAAVILTRMHLLT